MSNITEERLAELVQHHSGGGNVFSVQATTNDIYIALRELQRLRASAPVLSEWEREALEAGARELEKMPKWSRAGKYQPRVKKAALLRAMVERGKVS